MGEVGDMMTVRIRAIFDGEPVINSFGFFANVGYDTFQEACVDLDTNFTGALQLDNPAGTWVTGLSVQYKLQALEIVDASPAVSPMYSRVLSGVGTVDDDDAMPPNDALCVTWRSAFRGPSGRGRTYLTGFAEGAANGGYWEAGTQTYADLIAGVILNNFGEDGGSNFRFGILHKVSGGAPLVPPEFKPAMSYTVHNEVRSLGRRAVGRRIRRRRVAP
jgi:hypothetical protein